MPETAKAAVIVSGGTYGIGRQIVLELASHGHPVVAFGLEAEQPGSLAREGIAATRTRLSQAGLEADLLEADVSSARDVERVVQHALRRHGAIAGLVNNAAIRPTGDVLETDESRFDRVMAVNLKGPFLLCRAVIPHLRAAGGGAIVNLGSGASRGKPGLAAYGASKAGLHALTLALAEDHREDGIRVNLVVPAPGTASGMIEAMGVSPSASPSDVARAVAALLAPECEQTGAVIDLGS
jgi:NAD(P)-dependent dehydrogenase (short-subunit alcohol dehydrogenase family)